MLKFLAQTHEKLEKTEDVLAHSIFPTIAQYSEVSSIKIFQVSLYEEVCNFVLTLSKTDMNI